MEVPLAKLVNPGVEVAETPTVALAGLGEALYFSWSPDGRYIVQVHPALPPALQRRHILFVSLDACWFAAVQPSLSQKQRIVSLIQARCFSLPHESIFNQYASGLFIPISSAIPLQQLVLGKRKNLSFVILKIMLFLCITQHRRSLGKFVASPAFSHGKGMT